MAWASICTNIYVSQKINTLSDNRLCHLNYVLISQILKNLIKHNAGCGI